MSASVSVLQALPLSLQCKIDMKSMDPYMHYPRTSMDSYMRHGANKR